MMFSVRRSKSPVIADAAAAAKLSPCRGACTNAHRGSGGLCLCPVTSCPESSWAATTPSWSQSKRSPRQPQGPTRKRSPIARCQETADFRRAGRVADGNPALRSCARRGKPEEDSGEYQEDDANTRGVAGEINPRDDQERDACQSITYCLSRHPQTVNAIVSSVAGRARVREWSPEAWQKQAIEFLLWETRSTIRPLRAVPEQSAAEAGQAANCGFRQSGLFGLVRLLLGLLGLPLLFQRLLSRLLFHALLRVLVLGRHVLTSVWVRVRLPAVAQDVHHRLAAQLSLMCVAALPDASLRLHLRRLRPRSVQGLRRS